MALPTITKAFVQFLQADATLTGLVPGGIWQDIAPAVNEVSRPVIVFALESALLDGEAMTKSGRKNEIWRFRFLVVVEGLQQDITAIRNAVDRLMTMTHRTLWNGGSDWTVERSSMVELVERAYVDGQTRLMSIGGRLEIVGER